MYKETVIFPVKLKDVPIHTSVGISLYDLNKKENDGLIASTAFYLFDAKRRLRQGIHDLVLWKDKERDLSYNFTTPGFPKDHPQAKEINILFDKIRRNNPINNDKATIRALKQKLHRLYLESENAFLEINLPNFDYPVIFDESIYTSITKDIIYPQYLVDSYIDSTLSKSENADLTEERKIVQNGEKFKLKGAGLIRFHDPKINKRQHLSNLIDVKDNPVAEKYYILTRTEDDAIAKGLTTDKETHEEILSIIEHPDFTSLTPKEKNLLWKYRYSLKKDERYRKGVVKFLQSVNWKSNPKEEYEAIEMLQDWHFDQEQVLPMLSNIFCANEIYTLGIAKERCIDIRK